MTDRSPIGVIFDMDGVLVDSADAHLRSWQWLAEEIGREVTPARFAATFGRQNQDIIPLLFGDVSPARMQVLSNRKEELYRKLIRGRVPVVEGAAELIRALHESGARLAVGSSGPRANIDLALDALGATALMSAVVSAEDVTRGKPHPQVFATAAARLGIPSSRCVVVEDAPVGVQAAHAAGAKAIAVLHHHPLSAFHRPDLSVARLSDLTVDGIRLLIAAHG